MLHEILTWLTENNQAGRAVDVFQDFMRLSFITIIAIVIRSGANWILDVGYFIIFKKKRLVRPSSEN